MEFETVALAHCSPVSRNVYLSIGRINDIRMQVRNAMKEALGTEFLEYFLHGKAHKSFSHFPRKLI